LSGFESGRKTRRIASRIATLTLSKKEGKRWLKEQSEQRLVLRHRISRDPNKTGIPLGKKKSSPLIGRLQRQIKAM